MTPRLARLVVVGLFAAACQGGTAPTFSPTPVASSAIPAASPSPTLAPPTAVGASRTIHDGESTLINYQGGRYRFEWTVEPCASWHLVLAPTSGAAGIPLADSSPGKDGSVEADVPAGPAYLNSAGCPGHTITVSRAG